MSILWWVGPRKIPPKINLDLACVLSGPCQRPPIGQGISYYVATQTSPRSPPWYSGVDGIVEERDAAVDYAKRYDADICRVFVDSSCHHEKVEIGVCVDQDELLCMTVGSTSRIDNLYGELYAVKEAAHLIDNCLNNPNLAAQIRCRAQSYSIFTDSQAVIQSLCRPYQQSGQSVIQKILRLSYSIQNRTGVPLHVRWVPAHMGVPGNEAAHKIAQRASEVDCEPRKLGRIKRTVIARNVGYLNTEHEAAFHASTGGEYTKQIDQALPQRHTKMLYDRINKQKAAILCQLRTGKCRLNIYLSRIGAADDNKCRCGAVDSPSHLLFLCPEWNFLRQPLKEAAGPRWGDLSYALGGWTSRKKADGSFLDGRKDGWKPPVSMVEATLHFVEATGRLSYTYHTDINTGINTRISPPGRS